MMHARKAHSRKSFCSPSRRWLALLLAASVGLSAVVPASAIPPPPERQALRLHLPADGREILVEDEVRAYQFFPLDFAARAGDQLLLWLSDAESLLVVDLQGPSGTRLVQGARSGPDGLWLFLPETGAYRLNVVMSGDAARIGKAARFRLTLRLRH